MEDFTPSTASQLLPELGGSETSLVYTLVVSQEGNASFRKNKKRNHRDNKTLLCFLSGTLVPSFDTSETIKQRHVNVNINQCLASLLRNRIPPRRLHYLQQDICGC